MMTQSSGCIAHTSKHTPGAGNRPHQRKDETMEKAETRSDRAIKTEATRAEYARVYDNFCLPPRDIWADCRDGRWVRRAWTAGHLFGWGRWERPDCRG